MPGTPERLGCCSASLSTQRPVSSTGSNVPVHPDRARKVESLIRQARGGKLYQANGPQRGRGSGAAVESLKQTFDIFTRKYGLNRDIRPLSTAHFKRPDVSGQSSLF